MSQIRWKHHPRVGFRVSVFKMSRMNKCYQSIHHYTNQRLVSTVQVSIILSRLVKVTKDPVYSYRLRLHVLHGNNLTRHIVLLLYCFSAIMHPGLSSKQAELYNTLTNYSLRPDHASVDNIADGILTLILNQSHMATCFCVFMNLIIRLFTMISILLSQQNIITCH